MSRFDAQKALAMVQRAKDKGRAADITFKRNSEPEYIPGQGMVSTPIEWFGVAVVLPATQGTVEAFDVRFENGSLIDSKLRALLIPALGLTYAPMPGDTVEFPDGSSGVLLGCTPLSPDAANPIIYQGTVKL